MEFLAVCPPQYSCGSYDLMEATSPYNWNPPPPARVTPRTMLSSATDGSTTRQGCVYLTDPNRAPQERAEDRFETTVPTSALSCEDLYGEIVHPYTGQEYISTSTQDPEGLYVHPVCLGLSH